MIVILIEIFLIVVTYIISESYWTAGIAGVITVVGYILTSEGNNSLDKAFSVFQLACVSGFIYVFGANAKKISSYISEEMFSEMKNAFYVIGDTLETGATPPFDMTGDGLIDLTIFIFGFAVIEIILQIIRVYLKK